MPLISQLLIQGPSGGISPTVALVVTVFEGVGGLVEVYLLLLPITLTPYTPCTSTASNPQIGILLRVMFLAQARVALVVEVAVAEVVGEEELPDLGVGPVEDWEDSSELRPSLTAWTNIFKILGVGVGATVAHDDCLYPLLINKSLHLCLEI